MSIENIIGYIYLIKNKKSNKVYIGQTLSHTYNDKTKEWNTFGINGRILKHLQRVQQEVDYPLYKDIDKFGFQDFEINIEHELLGKNILQIDNLEKETIEKYDSISKGYNLSNNTNNYHSSKKQLYEYYNHTVQRSEEYKERKLRRSQLTISQKDRNSFFKDKIIDSVKINPIKEGGVVKTARVIFDIKNGELYRLNFTNKKIEEAYERALSFIKEVYKGNIDIHPFFTDDNEEKTNDVYSKARELQELNNKIIVKINGKSYFHKEINNSVYYLSIYCNDSKKRIMFGGKNITINNAYNNALEFINKLSVSKELCSLSCPQQAAAS